LKSPAASVHSTRCRFQTGDTAEFNSALHFRALESKYTIAELRDRLKAQADGFAKFVKKLKA
jgi:hypothetical protein